jgi:hypothetical protein
MTPPVGGPEPRCGSGDEVTNPGVIGVAAAGYGIASYIGFRYVVGNAVPVVIPPTSSEEDR